LKGDVVCDLEFEGQLVWKCLDPAACTENPPDIDNVDPEIWEFESDATIKFIEPPPELPDVTCREFSDKIRTEDIGSDEYWCEQGRVYKCLEKKNTENKRPGCSSTQPSKSTDGKWQIQRQKGTSTKLDASTIDARYGSEAAIDPCVKDTTLPATNAAWDTKTMSTSSTSGIRITMVKGEACTDSSAAGTEFKRRSQATKISVTPALPAAAADYNRQQKVLDSALWPDTLERAFKGIGYDDARDRSALLNVLSWFSGICT